MGGVPTVSVDVAPLSVFICLYLASAITNIIILKTNLNKGHKFLLSGLLVGFSMARVLTCVLRIAWSTEQHNVSLAIAAQIFVNAGILIVYIVNLLFAQRILRARRPEIGWHTGLRIFFRCAYVLIGCSLVLIIVLTVDSFFTLNPAIHSYAKWIQRGAILFLFCIAASPLMIVPLAFALKPSENAETFGKSNLKTKAIILMIGSCLCTTIAGFKVGTNWSTPRPPNNPAWYDSKAAFYVFNFSLEICILILYISTRVDHRFHVPDGSSKKKSYATDAAADRVGSEDGTEEADSPIEKKNSELSGDDAP